MAEVHKCAQCGRNVHPNHEEGHRIFEMKKNNKGIKMVYVFCSNKCRRQFLAKWDENKHKGCFITTSVCKTLNKPDNCLELKIFRCFRDTFMQSTSEMKAEIEEYYEIAPKICQAIDKTGSELSSEKYASIWKISLKPAFEMLVNGETQKAHDLYKEMVSELKREYL